MLKLNYYTVQIIKLYNLEILTFKLIENKNQKGVSILYHKHYAFLIKFIFCDNWWTILWKFTGEKLKFLKNYREPK